MKAAPTSTYVDQISTRLCKLYRVYKTLLPKPNYHLKHTEYSTKSCSSQKFHSNKQYIAIRSKHLPLSCVRAHTCNFGKYFSCCHGDWFIKSGAALLPFWAFGCSKNVGSGCGVRGVDCGVRGQQNWKKKIRNKKEKSKIAKYLKNIIKIQEKYKIKREFDIWLSCEPINK